MPITWIDIDLVRIPARPQGLWTLAQEYVAGGRLLRATVLGSDHERHPVQMVWCADSTNRCGPDGIIGNSANHANPSRAGLLCPSALWGALIGKIGGGTADIPDSTAGATPYGTKKVFAVGYDLILPLASSDGGPLFLTMNDSPAGFSAHLGELLVQLRYYPI
jgi:hypothetical protein